ncbi:MAG: hypothetical protein KDH15_01905 [Rhodocyclaceae bacterium]|nr:hypothetical protein [Rhodocyclaceae bacterium]
MHDKPLAAVPLFCTALSLSACGGGGDPATAAAAGTVDVALTGDDMERAGGTALTAAEAGSVPPADLGDLVIGVRADGRGPDGDTIGALLVGRPIAFGEAPRADAANGISLTRSEDCRFGGSVAITISDGDGSLGSGDALEASSSDCDGGEGVVAGRLSVVLVGFSGDFSPSGSATVTEADGSFEVASTLAVADLERAAF